MERNYLTMVYIGLWFNILISDINGFVKLIIEIQDGSV